MNKFLVVAGVFVVLAGLFELSQGKSIGGCVLCKGWALRWLGYLL